MRRSQRQHAFTLIEAIVVVTVMALLAVAVTVSLAGAARVARAEDVADAYATFDRATREAARRLGRTPELRFELNGGTVSRVDAERSTTKLALTGGFRVAGVVVRGRDVRSGEIAIPISARGQTPTYAVRLAGPKGADERWVVFAGLTGQSTVLQHERDVQDILAAAATDTGADAR